MKKGTAFALFVFTMTMATASWGQTPAHWALGVNYGYDVPTAIFQEWHSQNSQISMTFAYITAPNVMVEVEYQHTKYDHGKLEDKAFVWPVDGKSYKSPDARSVMTFNNLLANALIYFKRDPSEFVAKQWAPFLVVGAGFYHYDSEVSGMIYPGQKTEVSPGAGLDANMHLEPFHDMRTALGANIGLGLEAFIFDNISVDIRGRYNFIIGQLRPMEAWGIDEGMGIQYFDVGTGLRFYFE